MSISVVEATEATPELLRDLNRLLPQLSDSAAPMEMGDLEELVGSECSHLLVALDDRARAVGMLTLVCFLIPTGVRAWIEDVVVDQDHRRLGIGEALVAKAQALAITLGARTVDLTSRPSREAAHRLYVHCGFEARDTRVYRWEGT